MATVKLSDLVLQNTASTLEQALNDEGVSLHVDVVDLTKYGVKLEITVKDRFGNILLTQGSVDLRKGDTLNVTELPKMFTVTIA